MVFVHQELHEAHTFYLLMCLTQLDIVYVRQFQIRTYLEECVDNCAIPLTGIIEMKVERKGIAVFAPLKMVEDKPFKIGMELVSCRPYYLLVELSAAEARVLNSQAKNQFKSSACCHPIST